MARLPRLGLAFLCSSMAAGCLRAATSASATATAGADRAVLASPESTPLPTSTRTPPAATATPTPEPRVLPDYLESDCAGFTRPALAVVSYGGLYNLDPESLALMTPDGEERCTVAPPCLGGVHQLVGERVYHWAGSYWSQRYGLEVVDGLQVVDFSSGELTLVRPELDPELPFHWQFLVSPGGERIAWLVSDGLGTRHALYLTQADASEPRLILEYSEFVEYGGGEGMWYYLRLVGWTPGGDSLFFARQPPCEGGGVVLPQLRGSYVSLYQVDVETGVEKAVISLEEGCNACVADVSPDGRWLAYFLETGRLRKEGTLCIRDLESGEETFIEGNGWLCCARFSPDGSHLAYVELEAYTGTGAPFNQARTILIGVPFSGDVEAVAQETWSMWNRPVGWLDSETPILERMDGARSPGGYLWIAGTDPHGDRFPGCTLIGVLRD